jgi:oxygen-independent coproporphyrinogen-3 oxidase
MDHFALPDDDLALAQERGHLNRNFMGYTAHADSDVLGFGVSAISHVGATYSQNPRDISAWQAPIDNGRLPVFRGLRMSDDDRLRADVIESLMCQGEIPVAALERRYAIDFGTYFRDALARLEPMIEDSLLRIDVGRIGVTSQGRFFLRNIAMCFDAYIDPAAQPGRFSRAL